MAGVRYYLDCEGSDCTKSIKITRGDEVFFKRDLENKHDEYAVQMLSHLGKVLGYVPRYYSRSVAELLEKGRKIECHIYNVDKDKNCNECIKVIMRVKKVYV